MTFRTGAWAPSLRREDSRIIRVLRHAVFADKNGNISVTKMILFAVLHAAGNSMDRSEVLYSVMCGGGYDKHKFITHRERGILPALSTLIRFVTIDLVTLMRDIQQQEEDTEEIEFSEQQTTTKKDLVVDLDSS